PKSHFLYTRARQAKTYGFYRHVLSCVMLSCSQADPEPAATREPTVRLGPHMAEPFAKLTTVNGTLAGFLRPLLVLCAQLITRRPCGLAEDAAVGHERLERIHFLAVAQRRGADRGRLLEPLFAPTAAAFDGPVQDGGPVLLRVAQFGTDVW